MTTVLIAIAALLGLAALFGAVLGYASEKFKVEGDPIVEQIDALYCEQFTVPTPSLGYLWSSVVS